MHEISPLIQVSYYIDILKLLDIRIFSQLLIIVERLGSPQPQTAE
jgi:hypothetical protein